MNPWLAGAIGWWVLGGPIGGIVGFLGASFWNGYQEQLRKQRDLDDRAERMRTPPPHGQRQRRSAPDADPSGPEGNFAVSLMVLVAAVMMADGKATRDELAVVKTFLRDNFDAAFSRNALQLLKGLLGKQFDLPPVCRQIRQNMDIAARRTLLHLLYGVAWADGVLHPGERRVLSGIATGLGISAAEARSISSMFGRAGSGPEADYAILGVPPCATDAEVRSAYRKMAMKHHPDKVAHLGPDVQRAATEKFRAINEARERIKKSRGIK